MDDAKTIAAVLGSPLGAFLLSLLAWELLKTPTTVDAVFGPAQVDHLGPWNDAKSAITALTGICTVLSWAIVGMLWASGRD